MLNLYCAELILLSHNYLKTNFTYFCHWYIRLKGNSMLFYHRIIIEKLDLTFSVIISTCKRSEGVKC